MNFRSALMIPAALAAGLAPQPSAAQTLVPTPPFNSIELEGGGHLVLKHGNAQQVRLIKGSTQFTRFIVEADEPRKLRIEACNSQCPHEYDLEIEITTPAIQGLAISGGGAIESGEFPRADRLALVVKGGGAIDARSLGAAGVTAAVEGGGVIKLKADDQLTAAVHGGGRIRYWGNPRVTEAVEGGGTVDRGN